MCHISDTSADKEALGRVCVHSYLHTATTVRASAYHTQVGRKLEDVRMIISVVLHIYRLNFVIFRVVL